MRYRYVKAMPKTSAFTISPRIILSFFSISLGIGFLTWVAWPILTFNIFYSHLYSSSKDIISPLPIQAVVANNADNNSSNLLGVSSIDYTKAHNWFPSLEQKKTVTSVDGYTISIPKLKIQDAHVIIGSDDLNKSLIHYGGTSMPGEYGNAVIFGHSVLPQFYNPKDYNTIFSIIPTLKEGDEIFATYDGVTYTYIVEKMVVIDPDDVSGLEQRYDDSYMTLVTCVPPGTYFQRLWVTARIKKS